MSSSHRLHASVRRGPLPSDTSVRRLADVSMPHVQSFNAMVDGGLRAAALDVPAREIHITAGEHLRLWIEDARIGVPMRVDERGVHVRMLPRECREAGSTYEAPLEVTFGYQHSGASTASTLKMHLGDVPIMVRSSHCHLSPMTPSELVAVGEEAVEFGGYFICNGIERVIRMLQIPKRNYPMAITRNAYTARGPLYTDKGVVMRCVRPDQSGVTLTLHYLSDGSATVRFAMQRQEFFLPVIMILKALVPCTDREIYERVLAGDTGNTYLSDRLLMLLRDSKRYETVLQDQRTTLCFLGSRFKGVLDMPSSLSDEAAGRHLLDRFVLVHLPSSALRDKFNVLILMLRKLYLFVRGDVLEDNPDTLTNHELLLSGHFIQMFLKEKLTELLAGVETYIKREDSVAVAIAKKLAAGGVVSATAPSVNLGDERYIRKAIERQPSVGKKVYYLLATGNLVTSTGLDLMQVSGYTVVADKINFMRFTTHFRSVHRGQFFAEMKTTAVRKLLPENWGFLCPVHTPDGAPCGLLNHLAAPCSVVARPLNDDAYSSCASAVVLAHGDAVREGSLIARAADKELSVEQALLEFLVMHGMCPASAGSVMLSTHLPILLDGRLLGWAAPHVVYRISRILRRQKALTAAVRAGLERVGAGQLPGQHEEVCELIRACVLGVIDHRSIRSAEEWKLWSFVRSAKSETSDNPVLRATGKTARPDGIVPEVIVPPSMEISLIPPPWWDAEIDPHVDDATGARRTQVAATGEAAPRSMSEHKRADGELSPELDPADSTLTGLYPGLFLHTTPARLVRPVLQLDTGLVEVLSPTEQPFLDIACTPEDIVDILHVDMKSHGSKLRGPSLNRVLYTHIELSPSAMLSEVAAFVPFSDLNQSPRNMYQCLSADHDVLTVDGWRDITRVQAGDQVMTFNAATGTQEWNAVLAKTDLRHDGPLYRLSSTKMDAVVTAEHRWLLNSLRAPNSWSFHTTKDILGGSLSDIDGQWDRGVHTNCALPLVGTNPNPPFTFEGCAEVAFLPSAVLSAEAGSCDFLRLVGLVLGNGGVERIVDDEGCIEYYTCLAQPASRGAYIDSLLTRLRAAGDGVLTFARAVDTDGNFTYRCAHRALYEFFAPMCVGAVGLDPLDDKAVAAYDHAEAYRRVRAGAAAEPAQWVRPTSDVPLTDSARQHMRCWMYYPWLHRLSRNQARALLEGFVASTSVLTDGVVAAYLPQRGCVRGFHGSLPLINDLITAALLAEGRPEVGIRRHAQGEPQATGTCWSLTVNFDSEQLQARIPKPVLYEHPAQNGRVYCLTVANGTFMARRRPQWSACGAIDDARLSPFFTGNCQMGKQTMGTPVHSFPHRTDTKLFRLQNPQVPVVHNAAHAEFAMDEYPSGANAVVAVIAYTGYDMEDACIVNKSSFERGFGHASVYKVYSVDLQKDMSAADAARYVFHNMYMRNEEPVKQGRAGSIAKPPRPGPGDPVVPTLDPDGLPAPGTLLKQGDPMYVVLDSVMNSHRIVRHKEAEPAYVEEVRVLPARTDRGAPGTQRVSIKLRFNRNPIVGDKFSSRHGQKGVLSFLWPQEDMPFTDSGITPDVIINPHAFPSRMTIGMLVESMAGKAGALHGCFQDATPFQFSEKHRAVDYFGEQLRAAGYAYFGTETMYSGVTGEPMHCDIYLGVVYYQRLRHMVSDKAQARATGPINNLTRQPVKGRKKHGGIRFGEMERDSLLAHGASFLLHDRLHTCSDRHIALVCGKCGSILAPYTVPAVSTRIDVDGVHRPVSAAEATPAAAAPAMELLASGAPRSRRTAWCKLCDTGEHCVPVPMPYVFRYLVNELAAMNIKVQLEVGPGPYGGP